MPQLHGDHAHITSSDQCLETHDALKLIPGYMATFQISKCQTLIIPPTSQA